MQRPFRFHPGPSTVLVAVALCLMASVASGQVRRIGPGPASSAGAATGSRSPTTALPSPSGLTSGAAPGLVAGTPAASGLTSGSLPALPAGSPVASGLTSGTSGGTTATTTPDTTASVTGGSTRGVVVVPVDTGGGATATTTGIPAATGATTTTGTATGATAGTAGAAVVSGLVGVTNGVPSVAPGRLQTMGGGPLTALQVAELFAQADADGDGLLTRAEALRLAVVTMSFDDMDTNRDGVVSRSEYEASLR